ncbi:C170B-like protein, partial [Mya arenaria]
MICKDHVVSKAISLIGRLQGKYGFKPKFLKVAPPPKPPSPVPVLTSNELPTIYEEDPCSSELWDDGAEEGEWCLAEGVDKRHAVVTFDHYLRRFKIKDLSTESGTFVNNSGIPEQEYVVLEQHDTLRLGNDHILYGA